MADFKYKRILLKLSGEAIADKKEGGIFDRSIIEKIAGVIKELTEGGVQVGIVIGAGNIWRGAYGVGVKRARADHMGMLGTMINCLRMEDALEKNGCRPIVMSPIQVNSMAEPYDFRRAISYLEDGRVVLFGCGTGVPFVSTDTTAVIRAAEIEADIILMAKNVDGVYDRDPNKKGNENTAKKYKTISYEKCLVDGLHATDTSASALAEEQAIDMYVFGLAQPESILEVVRGDELGTFVSHDRSVEAVFYEN